MWMLPTPRYRIMRFNPGSCVKKKNIFGKFAERAAYGAGSPMAFTLALAVVLLWAMTGPAFHYSDTWQMVINTGTTIVTFLLVFLIQNSQNRDIKAVHIKLDELIRATEGAHTVLLDLEKLTDEELSAICNKYGLIAEESREQLRRGDVDTHIPEVLLD